MKVLKDADGHAVIRDELVVYVDEAGKEVPFDAAAAVKSIRARAEQSQRTEAEIKELGAKLKAFEGIEPDAARQALQKVQNLDAKKLRDAGEVDVAIAAAVKPLQEKLDQTATLLGQRETEYFRERLAREFSNSQQVARTIYPADDALKVWGEHFKLEDGKLIAYRDGKPIYGRQGEKATFEEAVESLIDAHPRKDSILKADNKGGSGAPNNPGGQGGKKTMTRAEWDTKGQDERQALIRQGITVTDQ